MSGDFHSQGAQLLHQSPHFRARGADLTGKFRPADHNGRKAHQHADYSSEARIAFQASLGPADAALAICGGSFYSPNYRPINSKSQIRKEVWAQTAPRFTERSR